MLLIIVFTIDFVLFPDQCNYKKLDSTAMDPGNRVDDRLEGGEVYVVEEFACERYCDGNSRCQSFTYCPGSRYCKAYDKVITEETETRNQSDVDDCRTHYRSCGNLNFTSMFHK